MSIPFILGNQTLLASLLCECGDDALSIF
jgi:hypothetical protein